MNHRIHILGASGSGTTTLGKALAEQLGCRHYDTDYYYWLPTNPPFQEKLPPEQRVGLMQHALSADEHWILSGSLCGWGDVFIPQFTLVVFLWLPPVVRMERLRKRERLRYGEAILPGGTMHEAHLQFLDWATEYDAGGLEMRSMERHEQWLSQLPCTVVRIEEDKPLEEKVEYLLKRISTLD